jgi:hypothetical protein
MVLLASPRMGHCSRGSRVPRIWSRWYPGKGLGGAKNQGGSGTGEDADVGTGEDQVASSAVGTSICCTGLHMDVIQLREEVQEFMRDATRCVGQF